MENTERTLAFASCVRGYHVYKDLWISVTNEELACRREPGNAHDPCTVAVTKSGIVGHVLQKMSACFSPQPHVRVLIMGVVHAHTQETKIKPTKIHFLT